MHLSANCRALAGFFAATAFSLFLASCASAPLDDLDSARPAGSAFNQALFKDYQSLAHSFSGTATEDSGGFFSSPLTYMGLMSPERKGANDMLAQAFAAKALLAARDREVVPEPATNPASEKLLARLVQDVGAGRDKFPEDAARAQADYDCWMLTAGVASQSDAASQCRTSLDSDLARLEVEFAPVPPPVATPAPASAAPSDYTVYFDFDSWTLSGDDLVVLKQVIDTARAGRQSHIVIVGHTDTSGPAGYNQKLSVHRANVVLEALVDMGARREAIAASGVGETDLAVQTADGVREPKNRRAVIGLQP